MVSMSRKKINTIEALESICIIPSNLSSLSKYPKTRDLLQKWGIDPNCYYPEISEFISETEWVKVLIFYARKVRYEPARNVLKNELEEVKKEVFGQI
jgi:hypothetical protein